MFWLVDSSHIFSIINYNPGSTRVTSRHDTQILDPTTTNGLQQIFYSFVKFYDGDYVMMIGWGKGKPSLVSYL